MTFRTLPERLDIGYTVICVKPMGPNPKQRMRNLSAVHYLLSRGLTYQSTGLTNLLFCYSIKSGCSVCLFFYNVQKPSVWTLGEVWQERERSRPRKCGLAARTERKSRISPNHASWTPAHFPNCDVVSSLHFFHLIKHHPPSWPICIITQLNFNGKFLYSSCCCESLTMPI